ncbi:MAG TPA: chloride channel protein [Steroidobacteraceae bacterium]
MQKESPPERELRPLSLALLAVLIGIVTGLGAVAFRALIGFIHNLLYYGHLSTSFDANVYDLPSRWGAGIVLVPVLGGLGVVFLVSKFAPEARGHGVPEVMDAIFYRDGKIRPLVAVIKSLASSLSIGSGAAVGREGPIIQIGASLGSSAAQLLKIASWQRITLVAAGAGAGIAATFNTPIGGVLFAIELLLPEVSVRTFLPVALATGTATFVGRGLLGTAPAFDVPANLVLAKAPASLEAVLLCVVLGVCCGCAATAFIRTLHSAERWFDRIANPYLRNVIGMTAIGIAMYAFLIASGRYRIDGVGYSTIEDILAGGLAGGPLMGLLFGSKMLATSVSLGSGSSGGIFSPSLFMGATLGGAFGALAHTFLAVPDVSVVAFAMVGMAALVGGATGAAMTAVTMIFEMTRDYEIVMPMIVAVAVSIGVRRVLSPENIYTIKLVGRRHFIPKAMHANMFLVRRAADVMEKDFQVLPEGMGFDEFLHLPDSPGSLRHIVVTRDERIVGTLRVNTAIRHGLENAATHVTLGSVASEQFTVAHEGDIMFDVIQHMWHANAAMVVVIEEDALPQARNVVGVLTKEHIADSVADSVRPYASVAG